MSIDPSNIPIEPGEPPQEEAAPPLPQASEEIPATEEAPRPGFWERMRRKKRRFLGKMVSNMVGENPSHPDESADATARLPGSIRSDIEESGFWGGIANRIKRTADDYLAQKLDEIELRIDTKLEEIDKRLSEWRDKEIANRLRIMKITLWASVIVAMISLIYAWLKVYFFTPK